MDREYLEDYEQKERVEYERLLKDIQEDKFSFERNRYPPNRRFVNLQKPVVVTTIEASNIRDLWAQVLFCGSLILPLMSFPQSWFETFYFTISSIPKIIDFVKETGRLQIALLDSPLSYEGFDHFDLFFKELNPPVLYVAPLSIFGNEKEIQKVEDAFFTLGNVSFLDFLKERSHHISSHSLPLVIKDTLKTYTVLKLGHFTIIEDIENLMVDNPRKALSLFSIYQDFIVRPILDLCSNLRNLTLGRVRASKSLPHIYQPQEIQFPCEIGKFLMKKLTYAPYGMDACKELMYHYDAYDLRKVQESLNEAIVTNHPDIVQKNTEELSEILDNVWSDKTIPRKVKGLQIGIPLSMAAIGTVAAGPIGAAGGFLAGLGYSIADKFIDLETEGLSERLAKLKTKSYQANVYDFKKKYKIE